MPKTIFDITSFHTKAGIGVQAYIKLDDQVIGKGASVPIATEQTLTITLYTGGVVTELKPTNMLSGSMYAITLDTQNVSSDDLLRSIQNFSNDISNKSFKETYSDEYLGAYLSAIGKEYMAEADMTKLMYADNYNFYTERYLSLCVTSFNLDMEKDVASQINIYEKGTIGLDVKSDAYSAVSFANSQQDIDLFYLNAGVRGSYLESEVLEKITGIESISTMKALDIAKEQGIEIITISKKDANYLSYLNVLQSNNIPSIAVDEITEKVEAGYEVIVPMKNISINSWSGIGYIIIQENGYSFMISNGTNGGEMTIPWDDWNENAGPEFIEGLYWLAFGMALTSAIISGIAFAGLFPGVSLSIATIIVIGGFLTSLYDLYTTGNDLVDYYSGEKTSKENVMEYTSIVRDLFISIVEWLLK